MLLAFLFPVALCALYCLVRGESLFKLYLPNSINNDCIFYYKLVEGTVSSGMPRGYFGFDESRALIGSFAAWNPFIVLPWVVFGKIFGWHYASVFISNLLFFSSAFCAFAGMTKIKWEQLLSLIALIALFPSIPIHLLNSLPETTLVSAMILFYAFAFTATAREIKAYSIVGMLVCSAFLTLTRPYMVLLFFVPVFLLAKKKKTVGVVISVVLMLLSVAGNLIVSHFFTSAYFTPLYNTEPFKQILSGQIRTGLSSLKYTFIFMTKGMLTYLGDAFSFGMTAGTQYVVAIFGMIALLAAGFLKDNKEKRFFYLFHSGMIFTIFAAIYILLQKVNEGGRHIWTFCVAGIFMLCTVEEKIYRRIAVAVLALLLGFFAIRGSFVPTDYDVPFADEELKAKVNYWEKVYEEKGIKASDEISYDNTVIWLLGDYVDGEMVNTDFRELFSLPEGMGINCCGEYYVRTSLNQLKSRYLALPCGGVIEGMCIEEGWTLVGKTETVAIYENTRADKAE